MTASKQSAQQLVVLLAICFLVLIRSFAGHTFVQGAIERAEIYSGVCLTQDPECSMTSQREVKLEGEISSALNLFLHLLSTPQVEEKITDCLVALRHVFNPVERNLVLRILPSGIFRPPRA